MFNAMRTPVAGAMLLGLSLTLRAQDSSSEQKGDDVVPSKSVPASAKGKSARSGEQRPGQPGVRSGNDAVESSKVQNEETPSEEKPKSKDDKPDDAAPRRAPLAGDERVIQFTFFNHPWDSVLEWFSELAGLSLQMEVKPPGAFKYVNDPNKYTIGEALDVLNTQLVPRGYTLIHKGTYLIVFALKEPIPADLMPRIKVEDLDQRGKSEFVTVSISLKNTLAKSVAEDLKSFKSEYGTITPFDATNRLMISDTVANIRLMRDYLTEINDNGDVQAKSRRFELKYVSATKVEAMLRDLLGMPPRVSASASASTSSRDRDRSGGGGDPRDFFRQMMERGGGGGFNPFGGGMPGGGQPGGDPRGGDRGSDRGSDRSREQSASTVTLAVDEIHNQIFVMAPPEKLAIVENFIKDVDVPREGVDPFKPREPQIPTFKVYRLSDGDAQSLATALKDLFKDTPGVRISADTTNNSVVVTATPDDQKEIALLVQQFENDERDSVVVPLQVLDATAVSELLVTVYSSGQRDWRGVAQPRVGQPKIVPDRTHNQLMIRGSKKQVDDIRGMLTSLGEPPMTNVAGTDKMRVIQLNGTNSKMLRELVEQNWRSYSPNNNAIRIIELGKRSENEPLPEIDRRNPANGLINGPRGRDEQRPPRGTPRDDSRSAPDQPRPPAERPDRTSRERKISAKFVSYARPDDPANQDEPATKTRATAKLPQPQEKPQPPEEGAPVSMSITPDGGSVVIISEDPAAVQRLEQLIRSLTGGSGGVGGAEYTVFYLKAADATAVQLQLNDLMGISSLSSSSFFGSSSSTSTSTLKIVPDTRTNSLIVYGNSNDVNRVRQLLEVLDRDDAPSSGAMSAPRIIPVRYANALSVSRVIRDVYASRITSGQGAQGGPGGFPFGGGNSGGFPFSGGSSSRSSSSRSGAGTLAIGVDEQSNSVVVSCSESLFQEVKKLVDTLDVAVSDTQRTVQIVTVGNSTPSAVQEALNGLMGVSTRTSSSSSGRSSSGDSSRSFGGGLPTFGGTPGGFTFGGGFPGGGSQFGGSFGRGSDGDRGRSFDSGRGGGGGPSPFGGGSGGFGGFGGGGSDRGRRPYDER